MKLLSTFAALALLTSSVLSAALPINETASPTVTMLLSRHTNCSRDDMFTVGIACTLFPADTESLQVMKVVNNGHVRYNSLRVYENSNCTGFGDIEPAWGCAGPGGDGCACSVVAGYKSIRLVVNE